MNVLETRGDYRVRVEPDEYPSPPDDDGQSPLLRITPGGWYRNGGVQFVDKGTMRPRDDDARIIEAVERWQTTPSGNDREWRLFVKYLRAYYGVTWETVDSCGGFYGCEYAEEAAREALDAETVDTAG